MSQNKALGEGEWSASRSGLLNPEETTPTQLCGPQIRSCHSGKEVSSLSLPGLEPRNIQPISRLTADFSWEFLTLHR